MKVRTPAKIAILTTYPPSIFQSTVNEIERYGHLADIIEWKNLRMSFQNGSVSMTYRGNLRVANLSEYKVLFNHVSSFICSYYYFAFKRLFKMKIVNDWEGILHSSDKLKSMIRMQMGDIKIPATVLLNNTNFDTGIYQAEDLIGYPMIMKETLSNNGEKVWLVKNRKSAWINWNEAYPEDLFLLQEYIEGENLRIVVLGDRVLYSVKNILLSNDFRANSRFNDGIENYTLSSDETSLMIKLTECLGLDFVGLDLIKADDGLYFIEANPKPGVNGDNEGLKDFGLDVYREIGRFLVEQLSETKGKENGRKQ